MLENPWIKLPKKPDFVLPGEEEEMVCDFNKKLSKAHSRYLHLDFVPEPFVGDPDAPIVILGNNPGLNKPKNNPRLKPAFVERMRANLVHDLSSSYPFLYLDPDERLSPPSTEWWLNKLKHLITATNSDNEAQGRLTLARFILAVDYFPYVSQRYGHSSLQLPSQKYSFALVQNAMAHERVIVLTRGERRWFRAIDGLETYSQRVRLSNVQRANISPGNCVGNGWSLILNAIAKFK